MTLAEMLCQFPREIAMQACSPIHGVPKRHRDWKPTAGQVRQWCEDESEHLYENLKFETKRLSAPAYDETTLEERKAHVARVLGRVIEKATQLWPGEKSQPGWITPEDAAEILAKYEREAKQQQSQDEELI